MEEDSQDSNKFSSYGIYEISQSLDFVFPNVTVRIKKISDNVFSYMKKDADDNLSEIMIPTKSSKIILEFSPIRPINYPAKRTSYVYLDLETPVFLSEGSAATIFITCPIEIGVFLVHDGHKDSLDWFACDPKNSRFGLYGTPESGTLCKYAKSAIVESYDDSTPFINGVLEINIQNELNEGYSVSKIVFPISDHSLYYNESRAIIDSISAVLKKKLTLKILDVLPKQIKTDWALAPTFEQAESVKRMDMGVD